VIVEEGASKTGLPIGSKLALSSIVEYASREGGDDGCAVILCT